MQHLAHQRVLPHLHLPAAVGASASSRCVILSSLAAATLAAIALAQPAFAATVSTVAAEYFARAL